MRSEINAVVKCSSVRSEDKLMRSNKFAYDFAEAYLMAIGVNYRVSFFVFWVWLKVSWLLERCRNR